MSAVMPNSRMQIRILRDATDGPYVSISSIRKGSVYASAALGTVRIVSERSEGPAINFLKVSKFRHG